MYVGKPEVVSLEHRMLASPTKEVAMRNAPALQRATVAEYGQNRQPLPIGKLIRAALPFVGIGAAVASVAWLPADTKVDSGILAAAVCLGALGISQLLSLAK